MNKERLLKLADLLEVVPEGKFILSTWEEGKPTKPEGEKEGECGFSGCAVGWAAHAKLFEGFSLGEPSDKGGVWPVYGEAKNWDAVSDLFLLPRGTEKDAYEYDRYGTAYAPGEAVSYLFGDESYEDAEDTGPKQVASRIRDFVATGEIKPLD